MKSLWLMLSQRRYFAPAWVFASINIMVGTWILYLPFIKERFQLNDAEVGSALFFIACGLLFSIPLVPKINKTFGVGRCTQVGIVLLSFAFNLPLIAPSYSTLCGSLFLVGCFSGFTDISMNSVISIIEKQERKNLMSAAHGFFSLGGFFGASLGSFLIGRITPPSLHMLLITVIVLVTN
ncbi:MAG: MFS transporter, partial [Flavobacteriaceae bacterium]